MPQRVRRPPRSAAQPPACATDHCHPPPPNPATPVRNWVLTWPGALEQRVLELQHAAVLALVALAEPVEVELRSRATQGLSEGPCS
jgi:hypothetical protein